LKLHLLIQNLSSGFNSAEVSELGQLQFVKGNWVFPVFFNPAPFLFSIGTLTGDGFVERSFGAFLSSAQARYW
jgi:hypothetical protein